jgi:hypothetical protein
MYFATKASCTRILVWLFWFIVSLVSIQPVATNTCRVSQPNLLLGVVSHKPENGPLFPWPPLYRWKQRPRSNTEPGVRVRHCLGSL